MNNEEEILPNPLDLRTPSQLKKDIAEWQERVDNFMVIPVMTEDEAYEGAIDLIEEARTLLLRASLNL